MQQHRVSFLQAISWFFGYNYCNFHDRSSRSEFWWVCLFNFIMSAVFLLIAFLSFSYSANVWLDDNYTFDWLNGIYGIVTLLPSLGLYVRRLHDTNRSGWNLLWLCLPIIGGVILLIYFCLPSDMHENQYGPVPNVY